MSDVTKFEIGRTYSCRSIADYECVWTFQVVSRTAKFVTIKQSDKSELTKVGIKIFQDSEYCHPLGKFSMAPSLYATARL